MLHPSSSLSSIEYSIKQYFIDNIENKITGAGIPVSFDATAITIAGIKSWILLSIDDTGIKKSALSRIILTLFLYSRKDAEGFELSKLRDTVYSILTGEHETIKTAAGMIPLFDISSKTKEGALTIMVDQISEGKKLSTSDGSNYKIMTIPIKMASK